MSLRMEKFFYFLGLVILGPSYMSPRAYGIMHNAHHDLSDTLTDPHSPYITPNFFKFVVKKVIIFDLIFRRKHAFSSDERYQHQLKENWTSFDAFASSLVTRFAFIVLYTVIYIKMDVPLYLYPVLLIHMFMALFQGSIHAWIAHKVGGHNFETGDKSRNTVSKDFYYLGELLHNNHHKYPDEINFAMKKGELDLGYHFLRLLRFLKIIKFTENRLYSDKLNSLELKE